MSAEISKDSITFLTSYTTAGYNIIPIAGRGGGEGKPPLPSPLWLLQEGVSPQWSSPPSAGGGIYPMDPPSAVTLIHSRLVWVLRLTWPVKNTVFEWRFDDLH